MGLEIHRGTENPPLGLKIHLWDVHFPPWGRTFPTVGTYISSLGTTFRAWDYIRGDFRAWGLHSGGDFRAWGRQKIDFSSLGDVKNRLFEPGDHISSLGTTFRAWGPHFEPGDHKWVPEGPQMGARGTSNGCQRDLKRVYFTLKIDQKWVYFTLKIDQKWVHFA